MKVQVTLEIENGEHPALGNRELTLTFLKPGDKDAQPVDPVSIKPTVVNWEKDGLLAPDGFDRFVVSVRFLGRAGGKALLSVEQALRLDESGTLVDHPQDAWPRSFGTMGQPLLSVNATVANGVAKVLLKVKTTVLDLTDHLLDAESQFPDWCGQAGAWRTWTLNFIRESAVDNGGCDLRILGVLDRGSKVWPYGVLIPPSLASGTTDVGVFVFYGPVRYEPNVFVDPAKPPGKAGDPPPLVNELFKFQSGIVRFVKAPGIAGDDIAWPDDAGGTFTYAAKGKRVPYFGPTIDGEAWWPNCALGPAVGSVNKPVILVLGWGNYPIVPKSRCNQLVRFLWGQDRIAHDKDEGVKVSRVAIAGFSFGGDAAMNHLNGALADDSLDEVYLIDSVTHGSQTHTWFLKNPDKRRLRLVCGKFSAANQSWGLMSAIKATVDAAKVAKDVPNRTGGTSPNFSFFPAGFFEQRPSDGKSYLLDYYSGDAARAHPTWNKAYEWVRRLGGGGKSADTSWQAHQWPAFGGEDGDPLASSYRTFVGRCLELSDF